MEPTSARQQSDPGGPDPRPLESASVGPDHRTPLTRDRRTPSCAHLGHHAAVLGATFTRRVGDRRVALAVADHADLFGRNPELLSEVPPHGFGASQAESLVVGLGTGPIGVSSRATDIRWAVARGIATALASLRLASSVNSLLPNWKLRTTSAMKGRAAGTFSTGAGSGTAILLGSFRACFACGSSVARASAADAGFGGGTCSTASPRIHPAGRVPTMSLASSTSTSSSRGDRSGRLRCKSPPGRFPWAPSCALPSRAGC